MANLIICKGLPGSGKTTWANGQHGVNVARVNKDDIRDELKQPWSRDLENTVIKIRDARILDWLKRGYTVISDDTNLAPKHEVRLRQLAAQASAFVEIKSFLDVPLEVCLERDAQRTGKARVGKDVIMKMYTQYLVTQDTRPPQVVVANPMLPLAIICDLDGTLALKHAGRNIYDASTSNLDTVNQPILDILLTYSLLREYKILYVSGREEQFREPSLKFLETRLCPRGPLWMRATGDSRNDAIVKLEIFDREIRGKFNVAFVLDDRPRVLRMWQELGLFTLAVGDLHEF